MPRTGDTRDAAREPAREAEFRRFVLATAVSVLGTYAAAIALAVRTYQDTGDPAWVSAVFAAEFLPPVAIGVLLADRLNRFQPRRALVASDLASAAVFAVVAGVHTPIAVVALATVAGAAAGIFRPISIAVVPAVVAEDRLDSANGTLAAVDTAMTAIGQAGAGAAVAITGAGVVLGANAASFVMSAALLASCGSLAAPMPAIAARTPLRRLRRSARTIRRNLPLRQVAVAWMPVLAAMGIVNSIEVPLLLGPLAAGAALTGLTIAAASAGQTFGSLLAGRLGEWLGRHYALVLTVVGASVLAAGVSPTVALVILLFIVGGIANGLAVVYNRSTVQRATDPEERAGILALLMSVGGVMTALGAAVGGAVASAASSRAAFAVAGAIVLVSAVAARLMAVEEEAAAPVGTLSPRAGRIRR
jgi:MFS family permease